MYGELPLLDAELNLIQDLNLFLQPSAYLTGLGMLNASHILVAVEMAGYTLACSIEEVRHEPQRALWLDSGPL